MSGRHNGGGEPNKRIVRASVTLEQKRERLDVIEQLMIRGVGTNKIEKACAERFGMTKGAVARYVAHLREQWAEEERQARPTNKATAQRRIYQHIQKARDADNWAAVASLERLLSDIQGTKEAIDINLSIDADVREAAIHVITSLTPEQRAEILEEQRKLRELAAMVDPNAVKPISVPEALPSPIETLE